MRTVTRWSMRICLTSAVLAMPWMLSMGGCPRPPAPGESQFVGAAVCEQCHANIHENWSDTLHAQAFDTLESVGHAQDTNCLPCHTTGFGQEGGFVSAAASEDLAGVQCEECHGPSRQHVMNVTDETLRPVVSAASTVCGKCHTTDAYPQFPQWQQSTHARVTSVPAAVFRAGIELNECGPCHSGDFRFQSLILGNTVPDDLLEGVPANQMLAQECVICHDPHVRTGNAVSPDDNRDFQLRYAEVARPEPTHSIAAITDPARYNLCGQCHHSLGGDWTATQRGPHHSVQSNIYIGEMSMPAGQENTPLVADVNSVHRFVPGQCATCHMLRQDTASPFAPPISSHTFAAQMDACTSATGCHPSIESAQGDRTALQTEVQTRLNNILTRLGPPETWQYAQVGGPADQTTVSDTIKQVRFLEEYVTVDGSFGVHNPVYVRAILTKAEDLLSSAGR